VDVARDLIDHRIADLDAKDAGIVDDVWVSWRPGDAELGPIVTGTAALLRQLGRVGACVASLGRRLGWSHAQLWREIPWTHVRRVERPQVRLVMRREELPLLPSAQPDRTALGREGTMRYTEFVKLPVWTQDGRRLGILDVRTAPHTTGAPAVFGLILAERPLGRSLGMKRYDTTTVRIGGVRRGCFLAWDDVMAVNADGIRARRAADELVSITDAPRPQAPPMPEGPVPP
jgi:sporulation protein YlmC with PRC-barrel domain